MARRGGAAGRRASAAGVRIRSGFQGDVMVKQKSTRGVGARVGSSPGRTRRQSGEGGPRSGPDKSERKPPGQEDWPDGRQDPEGSGPPSKAGTQFRGDDAGGSALGDGRRRNLKLRPSADQGTGPNREQADGQPEDVRTGGGRRGARSVRARGGQKGGGGGAERGSRASGAGPEAELSGP